MTHLKNNHIHMRKRFVSVVLLLFMASILSSCSIFSRSGGGSGYHPQKHRKVKVKDCGCEVINLQPKTFYVA